MEEADFDEAIISHADGRRQTMTKVDYYRQPLKARGRTALQGTGAFSTRVNPSRR